MANGSAHMQKARSDEKYGVVSGKDKEGLRKIGASSYVVRQGKYDLQEKRKERRDKLKGLRLKFGGRFPSISKFSSMSEG